MIRALLHSRSLLVGATTFFFLSVIKSPKQAMSLNRKIFRKRSQEEKRHKASSVVQSQLDSKTAYATNSPRISRRISDPGFYRTANPFGNPENSSRFPKLVVENAPRKKMNGVVILNKQCERKYRSCSDPCGEFTENTEKVNRVATFYKDVEDTFLPRLGKARNVETDSVEEKSFCDSLSSYPCSSIPSRSHSVLRDGEVEDFFVLKHEIVFSWVYGSRYGRKKGNRLPSSM